MFFQFPSLIDVKQIPPLKANIIFAEYQINTENDYSEHFIFSDFHNFSSKS